MRILLIEDENDKMENINEYVKHEFKSAQVDLSKSYTTALKNIYRNEYDVVLLDMSLPFTEKGEENFENNEFETFGGINILDELKRLNYHTNVIVITAFDVLGENDDIVKLSQLNEEMKEDYNKIYVGCILYNSSSIEWKQELKRRIEEYINK